MKKLISMILLTVMVLGLLTGCGAQSAQPAAQPAQNQATPAPAPAETEPAETAPTEAASGEPIKIGVIGALAADGKFSRYSLEIGYQLMRDMYADAGMNVEFIVKNLDGDGSVLKQRMTELKEAGCVAILAPISDDVGPAAAQWAAENKLPVVYTSNYSTEMSITNYSDYIFCSALNAWGFIKVLAKEAVGVRGMENYAYVGSDGAGAIDAENILLYEGKKINPDFHCVASYRMGMQESDFSTVIATLLSMEETPQMTLQQGGPAVISFIMQAAMYDYYSTSSVWSDVGIMASVVPELTAAGVYSYEGSYGATPLAWWSDDFKPYREAFLAKGQEIYNTKYWPVETSLYLYWGGEAVLNALQDCIANGVDYTDGEALKNAIEAVSFTEFGSEHHFRDFDHQMTMNIYFVDAVDAGEEFDHLAMAADPNAVYSADEYLPTMEEMKTYGEEYLGVTGRFD